ncbi:MAG: aspartyl protease family protein [Planctomycetes bacterium]|nr:aspartyl protease family protein [Planctomycetota bacterium]
MSTSIVEPKRGTDVGRVVIEVTVENYVDVERAERGELAPDQVRRLKAEALVDSGATYLCLPKSLIERLGLVFQRTKEARTVTGPVSLGVYGVAKVYVQGRDCISEVMELPEGRTPLLGQIPLELMDWWIDVSNQRLVGNPEHGGQWMADVF